MKNSTIFVVIFTLFSTFNFAQSVKSNEILEKAGKQRILSEKMAKDYLMIDSNINIDEAKIDLDVSKSEFNQNLIDLFKMVNSTSAKDAIKAVERLWLVYKVDVSEKPTPQSAVALLEKSNVINKAGQEMITKITAELNSKNSKSINICNKQKMNAQKIAKLCLASNLKIPYKNLQKDLDEAIASYEFSFVLLKQNQNVPQEVDSFVNNQTRIWTNIKSSFDIKNNLQISAVLENTNTILKDFNEMSTFYLRLQPLTGSLSKL